MLVGFEISGSEAKSVASSPSATSSPGYRKLGKTLFLFGQRIVDEGPDGYHGIGRAINGRNSARPKGTVSQEYARNSAY